MFFNSGRIFRTDYVSLVTAILYVFIFRFIYTDYLVPLWGYFGYYNNNSDGIRIITSIMLFKQESYFKPYFYFNLHFGISAYYNNDPVLFCGFSIGYKIPACFSFGNDSLFPQ